MLFPGTDEDAVIKILGNHNWQQRMEIAESYKAAYGAVSVSVSLFEHLAFVMEATPPENCHLTVKNCQKLDIFSKKEMPKFSFF